MNQAHKKSTHPFRLWGSYAGLLIGLIGSYFSFALILDLGERGQFQQIHLLIPLLPPALGFLVGWGIHKSIARKPENPRS